MKQLLTVLMIFFCISNAFAQKSNEVPFKRFGFQAGANIANMNFNKGEPTPSTPVKSSWKSGITIGFLIRVPLAENFFLQPEYIYSQRKGEDKSTGINYAADYVSLPVLLNYKISSRFNLLAGAQAELLVHAKEDKNGVTTNITHDMEERSIGATAGFEFHFTRLFFISGRYMQGLNHIGIGQRSALKEFKYEVVNLSLGVGF